MTAGLATAILSVGEYTLAPDDAGRFILESFSEAERVDAPAGAAAQNDKLRAAGRRVPGLGHTNFRFPEPRAQKLKRHAPAPGDWGPMYDGHAALHHACTNTTRKHDTEIERAESRARAWQNGKLR